MQKQFTTRSVGEEVLGVAEWRIRRLYESGALPEPERFGNKRVITSDQIPAIVDELRKRGWLPNEEVANAS